MPVSGSTAAPPGDVGPAVGARTVDRGTVVADRWRVEKRTQPVLLDDLQRLGAQLGCEVDQVVLGDALHLEGGGTGHEWLGGGQLLAGHVGLRHVPLLDRPHGLAGLAVEHVRPPLLGHLHQRLDVASVHRDVDQVGCGGVVVVPDVVVHGLEVPAALAGPHVEGQDARREEVVARVETAVVVDGGAGRSQHRRGPVRGRRRAGPTPTRCRSTSRRRSPRCRSRIRPPAG